MVVRFIFSSILQIWYVEVWISQGISEDALDFEITGVDCILSHRNLSCASIFFPPSFHLKAVISGTYSVPWFFIFLNLTLKAPITTAADNNFLFVYFSEKKSWCFIVLGRQFTWNVKTCFLWEKKFFLKVVCFKFLLRALRVKNLHPMT